MQRVAPEQVAQVPRERSKSVPQNACARWRVAPVPTTYQVHDEGAPSPSQLETGESTNLTSPAKNDRWLRSPGERSEFSPRRMVAPGASPLGTRDRTDIDDVVLLFSTSVLLRCTAVRPDTGKAK